MPHLKPIILLLLFTLNLTANIPPQTTQTDALNHSTSWNYTDQHLSQNKHPNE